jgi:hypothetical protein
MSEKKTIDITFIRRGYFKIKSMIKLNNSFEDYYDFNKNLYYGKREFKKIHLETDTKLEKRFKSYITFWGSVGYLAWDQMIENNLKKLSIESLEKQIIKMGNCYTNNKNFDEFEKKELNNRKEKKHICDEMYKNLSEKDFTKTLNNFIHKNSEKKIVAIKFLTPRNNSKSNIKSIKDLEKERWMSFTILPKAKFSLVCKNPYNYLLESSVGNTVRFEYMIIEIPVGFEFVKTNNLCDLNEILINSSELIKKNKKMKFEFI